MISRQIARKAYTLTLTGLEGHICPTIVKLCWRHCDIMHMVVRHAHGGATKNITLCSGDHELLNYGE